MTFSHSAWPPLATRATDLTPEARRLIAKFRQDMRAHLPGETLKLYIPQHDAVARAEQRRRILRSLRAGEKAADIAKREGVSERFVRQLRGTLHP